MGPPDMRWEGAYVPPVPLPPWLHNWPSPVARSTFLVIALQVYYAVTIRYGVDMVHTFDLVEIW